MSGETGQKHSAAPQKARRHCHDPRMPALHPQSADEGREHQKKPANEECRRDLRNASAKFLRERYAEDAPRVGRSKSHLQEHTGNGDPPTIYSWHVSSTGAPSRKATTNRRGTGNPRFGSL